jgi:hypothetical protein
MGKQGCSHIYDPRQQAGWCVLCGRQVKDALAANEPVRVPASLADEFETTQRGQ